MELKDNKYSALLESIGSTLNKAKSNAFKAVNFELLKANWLIGKYLIEFEQEGNLRAEYGKELLPNLSKDLKSQFGKGFSRSNLQLMRLFFVKYNKFYEYFDEEIKSQTVSGNSQNRQTESGILLSWSHYSELLTISDDLARAFYENQALIENWSFRELKRQIDSALFQRLALSNDKNKVFELASKGQIISKPKDIIKDPYVFEFLDIKREDVIKEKGLERKLLENLQSFLLELGKGFSFVGRQYKITVDNEHFYIDLVFYHRILKCFVLIDLKTRKVKHHDIGQMNLYLNYFLNEENIETDNEPIGLIIAADKHDFLVKYATGGLSSKIFVSKYQLYLPEIDILEEKLKEIIDAK